MKHASVEQTIKAVERELDQHVDHGFDAAHDDQHVNGEIAIAAFMILSDIVNTNIIWDGWMYERAKHVLSKYPDKTTLLDIAASMLIAESARLLRMRPGIPD